MKQEKTTTFKKANKIVVMLTYTFIKHVKSKDEEYDLCSVVLWDAIKKEHVISELYHSKSSAMAVYEQFQKALIQYVDCDKIEEIESTTTLLKGDAD